MFNNKNKKTRYVVIDDSGLYLQVIPRLKWTDNKERAFKFPFMTVANAMAELYGGSVIPVSD